MTYNELIQNILDNRGRFACGDEYHERHHIDPRCCDGCDDEDNLIDLFAREHYEAHRLLALENPDNEKLVYAWWMMSHGTKTKSQDRYELTAEEYEEAKKAFSQMCSKRSISEDQKQKLREFHTGLKASEETKRKMSIARSGEKNPNYGKSRSEETKKKISQANIGHRHTEEYKAEKSIMNSGSNNPNYGNKWTMEQKQKQSERMSGENHPNYGKSRSEETKKKISEANTGRPKSESQKKKQSETMKGKYVGNNNPNHISIYCPELDEEFWGGRQAHEKYGISCSGISQCLRGHRKSAGKHPITGEPLTWVKLENN